MHFKMRDVAPICCFHQASAVIFFCYTFAKCAIIAKSTFRTYNCSSRHKKGALHFYL